MAKRLFRRVPRLGAAVTAVLCSSAAAMFLACGSSSSGGGVGFAGSSGTAGTSGTAGLGGAGDTQGEAGKPGSSGSAGASAPVQGGACGRYVACTAAASPSDLEAAKKTHGPDGACWKIETEAGCEKACEQGTAALHAMHPEVEACGSCASRDDCGGATPACSPDTWECVACNAASDCKGSQSACDPKSHTCVACATDGDCSGELSACDPATNVCVACTKGSQCSSGACNADRTCCERDSVCPDKACGDTAHDDGCGKKLSCGSCGEGAFCNDTGYCNDVSPTFACKVDGKPAEQCPKGEFYCWILTAGPGSSSASCKKLPAACANDASCACLAQAKTYSAPDTCNDGTGPDGVGAVTVYGKL